MNHNSITFAMLDAILTLHLSLDAMALVHVECLGRTVIPMNFLQTTRKISGWHYLKPLPHMPHRTTDRCPKINLVIRLMDVR